MRSFAAVSLKSTQILRPVSLPLPGSIASHPGLIQLFGDDEELRTRFQEEAKRVLLPGGHTLFREGDPSDHLYLVVHGRLQVHRDGPDGARHVIGEIGTGGICGERALLLGSPHSATVRAQRDSELLELSRDGFDRLIAKHPHAMNHVARTLVGRMSPGGGELPGRSAVATVAVVPLHGAVPLGRFARQLTGALERFGTVRHLDAGTTDGALGADAAQIPFGDGEGRLTGWLHDQEIAHDFVVLEADPTLTRWSRRCIRQADRVLLLAEAGADASGCDVDEYLRHRVEADRAAERELVLLRREGGGYEVEVARWLKGRALLGHHHVDLEIERDLGRLARTLAGRAVGVVFSGGGARTMAHIGAVRAIREAGIPIDRVGGVSGGSIFAAQVALGWDDETMAAVTRELLVGDSLLDFSVPVISVIKGKRWRRVLREMFGQRRIETLRIPYFCVSTNLSRGELAVHREGLLWRWVRASLSIPGLAPPLVEDGELYVDGSVLNNLPIDVMRDLAPGPVIALTVGSGEGPRSEKRNQDHVPSKWSALKARLVGGDADPAIPSIVDILMGAAMVGGRRMSMAFEPMANLVIHPDLSDVGLLEFSAMDRCVEEGYRLAVEALEGWDGRPAAQSP